MFFNLFLFDNQSLPDFKEIFDFNKDEKKVRQKKHVAAVSDRQGRDVQVKEIYERSSQKKR